MESESDSTCVAALTFSSVEDGGAVRCFGSGTPVHETRDVLGPDETAADEPGTATSFALSAATPEAAVPDEHRGRAGY